MDIVPVLVVFAACRTSGPKRPSPGRMGQIRADCLAGCVNTNLPWERNLGDVGREPRRRGTPDLWSSCHTPGLLCSRLASTTGLTRTAKACGGCLLAAASEMTADGGGNLDVEVNVVLEVRTALPRVPGPSREPCIPYDLLRTPSVLLEHRIAVVLSVSWHRRASHGPTSHPPRPTRSDLRHGRHPRAGLPPSPGGCRRGKVATAQRRPSLRCFPHGASSVLLDEYWDSPGRSWLRAAWA